MGNARRGKLGDLVHAYRTAAGLTQEELAERAGLSARGVQDLERGKRRSPHPETTRRLAAALGLREAERSELLGALEPVGSFTSSAIEVSTTMAPLPTRLTSFVGRLAELDEVKHLLGGTRLLTLAGAGGIGKTRLALEAASRLSGDYPDGAVLVELGALANAESVPQAVAQVVGVPERPGYAMQDTLASSLRRRNFLLVIDNCEHLIQASASLAELLLRTCPGLSILAPSREPLRAEGETVWRVPSLSAAESAR